MYKIKWLNLVFNIYFMTLIFWTCNFFYYLDSLQTWGPYHKICININQSYHTILSYFKHILYIYFFYINFIDGFALKIGSLLIAYWLSETKHIYWNLGIEVEVHLMRVLSPRRSLRLQEQLSFEAGGVGIIFNLGPKKVSLGRPRVAVHIPDLHPIKKLVPKELVGVGSVLPFIWESLKVKNTWHKSPPLRKLWCWVHIKYL